MVGDIRQSRMILPDRSAGDNRPDGDDHECENREYLDGGEPEFGLAERLDAQHVEREHRGERAQGEHPLGNGLEHLPVVEIQCDCGDIRHDGSGPVEEEQPAGDVRAFFAEKFACVGHERARGGASDRQFAERADHEECENAAYRIRDGQAGAALGEASARAEEQAGAD